MECVRCGRADALGRAVVASHDADGGGELETVLCAICADATLGHLDSLGHGCAFCHRRAAVRLPRLDCVIERADGTRDWEVDPAESDADAAVPGLCERHHERVTTLGAPESAPPDPESSTRG